MTLTSISSTLDLMAGVQVLRARGRDMIRRRREVRAIRCPVSGAPRIASSARLAEIGDRLGLPLGETVGALTSVASTYIRARTLSFSNNARQVARPNSGQRRLPEFTVFRIQATRRS